MTTITQLPRSTVDRSWLSGGALTGSVGWRWIFLVNVPIGAAAMTLAWWRVRDSRNPKAAGVARLAARRSPDGRA